MNSRPVGDLRKASELPEVVPAIATSRADRSGHIVPAHPQTRLSGRGVDGLQRLTPGGRDDTEEIEEIDMESG